MRSIFAVLLVLSALTSPATVREVDTPSGGVFYDKYASTVFDREGRMWVVFTSMRGDEDQIVVRSRSGRIWSAEQRLDGGEGVESGAKLIVDGGENLRVVWHGRRKGRWAIFTRSWRNRSWGPEQVLSSPSVDALHPVVIRDRSGRVWIAWEITEPGGFALQLVNESGKTWSRPATIQSAGSDRRASLAAADQGVWVGWDSTRSGNYDIWLARATANGNAPPRVETPMQLTRHATIDDSPSLATTSDGTLWVVWNGMRGHSSAEFRADRHNGDAFVRVLRDGRWLTPPGVVSEALPGQVSFGSVTKTPRDAVPGYWQWKQTQNYPIVAVDQADRAWIIWRTDATGAHNFDLWGRVHDGRSWSPELHLTKFSPGRDEWPSIAHGPVGTLQLTWEGQVLPKPGEEAKYLGGDVDSYNTLGLPNVILTGSLQFPADDWKGALLTAVEPEVFNQSEMNEPMTPGPAPRTAQSSNGKWKIYFGDPHSHTILSDGKTGLPDQILQLARDPLGLDYAVVSDHSEMGHLQAAEYAELQLTAKTFNQPGRFVSLTGWEWTSGSNFGHRVVLFRGEGVTPISAATPQADSIEKLYEHVRKDHGVMSPHHTGQATWGRWNPNAHHDEELEPNFEIASWHGRFEFYGNPWEGRRQVPGHHYQDALRKGRHVGAMAASDTHHLSPGEGGLTAVLAERLDRASIFDAISSRRNYATTGARIVLEFEAAGAPMGSRITASGPLEMRVRIEGTASIDRVEIIRNLVDTFAAVRIEQNPSGLDGVFLIYEPRESQGGRRLALEDMSRLTFTVTDMDQLPGETSYYVRVTQTDGQQAWSSPIWVTR